MLCLSSSLAFNGQGFWGLSLLVGDVEFFTLRYTRVDDSFIIVRLRRIGSNWINEMRQHKYYVFCLMGALLLLLLTTCSQKTTYSSKNRRLKELRGRYHSSSFQSRARGLVHYSVYLPPKWSQNYKKGYPLLILLHGQGRTEKYMPTIYRAEALNSWINQKKLPEMVVISLRGSNNPNEIQWYTKENMKLIVDMHENELIRYCQERFQTSVEGSKISIIGHSRGATGALNFALTNPDRFASILSYAFVSDYALDRLKEAAINNLEQIKSSGIKMKLVIGTEDEFYLNRERNATHEISKFFDSNKIEYLLEVLEGENHQGKQAFQGESLLHIISFCSASWSY